MKKIYALLVIIFITFSCSTSDDFTSGGASLRQPVKPVTRLDPTKLARVIFYPGTTYERVWFFYPDGLLKKITNPNGTILKDFIYDSHKNLITSHTYSSNGNSTYIFTYDSSNHITSVNGRAVTYNAVTNQYIFQYQPIFSNDPECPTCFDYADRTEITLNSDLLITDERTYYHSSDGDYSYGGMFAGYSDNNMAYVSGWTDPSGPSYSHDSKINPLKPALIPVCRAMALANGSYSEKFAIGEYNSINNVIRNDYGVGDPESEEYIIEYNSNDLPFRTTHKSYYHQTLESIRISALYYYQGDVIP